MNILGLSSQYLSANFSIILSIFCASPGSLKLHRNWRRADTISIPCSSCWLTNAFSTSKLNGSLKHEHLRLNVTASTEDTIYLLRKNLEWMKCDRYLMIVINHGDSPRPAVVAAQLSHMYLVLPWMCITGTGFLLQLQWISRILKMRRSLSL